MIEDISNEKQQKSEESAIQNEAELDNNFEEVETNNHNPWISLKGKKALVTGAGKGIGSAIAIKLAECGAEVIAISGIPSDLNELEKSNGKIKTLCLDVGDWEETKSAITSIGHIDLLVNNASVGVITKFGDVKEEDIDETYNVNLKAIINISQIVVKDMKERGKGGSIVNVSSMSLIQTSNIGMSIDSSSKCSVDQLTRCMALELGPHHIRVNAVKPVVMHTQMSEHLFDPHSELGKALIEKTPLKRLGNADEIAFPILFLLSDYASFINGVILTTDGGLTTCFQ
ncbi:L-xylulose reductase [Parasteatoda tepidariorum]|uniref:L-xylulose reductase n=1 Tax=Parasteatoda tepidariorum TaxID=114398 RepID=UPI00077FB331|nr:L-xylulose reductase [Parasteatoda tepidariorum]